MVRVNFIDEDYDEIESVVVKGSLLEVFAVIDKTTFFNCGEERLRHEKVEMLSIDFMNEEISVRVIRA